ncbi:MAG: TatD family hydrolase [Gammaproteobacteria bacterium]|nr:TatD family hydrolase [Gammaproteobacteria bacterium]
MPALVDSHCHLDLLGSEISADTAIRAAREQGVEHLLSVSVDQPSATRVVALARRYPEVFCSAGVHPTSDPGEPVDPGWLQQQAARPEVVAVGETGLDYHYCSGDTEWQRQRFRLHIQTAKALGKPLIIHLRDAAPDLLRILLEEDGAAVGGVLHCFTDTLSTASVLLEMGFYISFSGILTFKSAADLRAVARQVPADRILVETDSPWLAPVPHRGKPNQPAHVRHVAACLAEVRGVDVDRVAEQTTENFFRLFASARRVVASR